MTYSIKHISCVYNPYSNIVLKVIEIQDFMIFVIEKLPKKSALESLFRFGYNNLRLRVVKSMSHIWHMPFCNSPHSIRDRLQYSVYTNF